MLGPSLGNASLVPAMLVSIVSIVIFAMMLKKFGLMEKMIAAMKERRHREWLDSLSRDELMDEIGQKVDEYYVSRSRVLKITSESRSSSREYIEENSGVPTSYRSDEARRAYEMMKEDENDAKMYQAIEDFVTILTAEHVRSQQVYLSLDTECILQLMNVACKANKVRATDEARQKMLKTATIYWREGDIVFSVLRMYEEYGREPEWSEMYYMRESVDD